MFFNLKTNNYFNWGLLTFKSRSRQISLKKIVKQRLAGLFAKQFKLTHSLPNFTNQNRERLNQSKASLELQN